MASSSASAPSSTIRNHDLLALRSYVTAKDGCRGETLPSDLVLLDLTHSNLRQQHIETRFFLSETVDQLRHKIYQKTGTPPRFQELQIWSSGVRLHTIPASMEGSSVKLGYFSLAHGMRIHCVDLDPCSGSRNGQYEDTSLVAKYRMSDEEYDRRKGTLRDWTRQQTQQNPKFSLQKHAKEHREWVEAERQAKLGLELPKGFEYDGQGKVRRIEQEEEEHAKPKDKSADDLDVIHGLDSVRSISVGLRCEIQPGSRRGVVAFVGLVPELSAGYWVGVRFDEPVGKTDGTVPGSKSGRSYFTTPGPNYGGFLRGKNVTVGDFPERDILWDSDEDEL